MIGNEDKANRATRRPRTKIIATLGPASSSESVIRGLIQGGMSVARLNFAHGDQGQHRVMIGLVREVARSEEAHVAILGDLRGPRIRLGHMDAGVTVVAGHRFRFDARPLEPGDALRSGLAHFDAVANCVVAGHSILVADGALRFRAVDVAPDGIETVVEVGGEVGSHKGVNLPDSALVLEPITALDRADVAFAVSEGVDYIGFSFAANAHAVGVLKSEIEAQGGDIPVIAKIERRSAVDDIDAILNVADGIMVARGDLALEIGAAHIPLIQKRLIARANRKGKPVITATQMLDSMMRNPTPTRAETSDVANAILDGTDAVMLSGESAIGLYPVETVRQMAWIAAEAEGGINFGRPPHGEDRNDASVAGAVGAAAVGIASRLKVAAVVAATTSGSTARIAARFRPEMPLIGVTSHEAVCRRMSLVWGVRPALVASYDTTEAMMERTFKALTDLEIAEHGDRFVVISGQPIGTTGSTNMVQVRRVGDNG